MKGNGSIVTLGADMKPSIVAGYPLKRMAVGLVPFTPVPFKGKDTYVAIARIAIFSAAAYLTYNKAKKVSYALIGAAGISLANSIMTGIWSDQ